MSRVLATVARYNNTIFSLMTLGILGPGEDLTSFNQGSEILFYFEDNYGFRTNFNRIYSAGLSLKSELPVCFIRIPLEISILSKIAVTEV